MEEGFIAVRRGGIACIGEGPARPARTSNFQLLCMIEGDIIRLNPHCRTAMEVERMREALRYALICRALCIPGDTSADADTDDLAAADENANTRIAVADAMFGDICARLDIAYRNVLGTPGATRQCGARSWTGRPGCARRGAALHRVRIDGPPAQYDMEGWVTAVGRAMLRRVALHYHA
jgi:hypothetical protein